ncbi:unnamed protein product [Vicia faba]|uniref:Uncharacterized protein n=1 Tax=Vicia faba TaxID=3906 RepID=A0AAV1ANE1_VICFA|nr:unnamed protein product [Vicia faba]
MVSHPSVFYLEVNHPILIHPHVDHFGQQQTLILLPTPHQFHHLIPYQQSHQTCTVIHYHHFVHYGHYQQVGLKYLRKTLNWFSGSDFNLDRLNINLERLDINYFYYIRLGNKVDYVYVYLYISLVQI